MNKSLENEENKENKRKEEETAGDEQSAGDWEASSFAYKEETEDEKEDVNEEGENTESNGTFTGFSFLLWDSVMFVILLLFNDELAADSNNSTISGK